MAGEQPRLAFTRWALRSGGVVVGEPHQTERGLETWGRTEFSYYGVTVRAFAHIPARKATQNPITTRVRQETPDEQPRIFQSRRRRHHRVGTCRPAVPACGPGGRGGHLPGEPGQDLDAFNGLYLACGAAGLVFGPPPAHGAKPGCQRAPAKNELVFDDVSKTKNCKKLVRGSLHTFRGLRLLTRQAAYLLTGCGTGM